MIARHDDSSKKKALHHTHRAYDNGTFQAMYTTPAGDISPTSCTPSAPGKELPGRARLGHHIPVEAHVTLLGIEVDTETSSLSQ